MTKALIILWLIFCGIHHGVPLPTLFAVAQVECRTAKGKMRWRGRLGRSKFWAPGGINEDCFPDTPEMYRNPYCNAWVMASNPVQAHSKDTALLKKRCAATTPGRGLRHTTGR